MNRMSPVAGVVVAAAALVCLAAAPTAAAATAGTPTSTAVVAPPSVQYVCMYQVTGDGVRIRTGPATTYPAFGQMHRGDYVLSDALQDGWAHVRSDRHGSRWGWISLAYLYLVPGSCH